MSNAFFEFGGFRLDVNEHLLYRQDGQIAPLKPKVVETLELLVSERGRLVTKDELLARLWPDTIVGEANLSQNIYQLRKVLEAEEGHKFIETVPKRGYRFIGDVSKVPSVSTRQEGVSGSCNSIAVLPLTNESNDPTTEYLSDGITESIINHLAQLPQLKVIARSTVFRYKGRAVTPQKVGRELGVKAVLTGRVLEFNDRIIVRTELVDAVDGWQLWGEQYNRFASDLLELQEVIAADVSEKLQVRLSTDERKRLAKRQTTNTDAYHLFIKGRYYLNKRLTETIERAVQYFQEAIDLDPLYAAAYVGLADCYPLLTLYGALRPRDAYLKAEAAAQKALEIDSSIAEAHNALGVIKLFYQWDWSGAARTFKHAIQLNAGYADAHQRYGMLLVARREFSEAQSELAEALTLDPLSMITRTISGYPFYYSRDFERAAVRFREVIEMDPGYSMAHFRLGLTYAQQGLYKKALDELQVSVELSGDRDVIAAIGYVQGLAGNTAEAERSLAKLEELESQSFVSAYDRAIVYAGMGAVGPALEWIEKAVDERSYWLIYIKSDPALDCLRNTSRFAELEAQITQDRGRTVVGSNSEV
jgi:TolB-like protein/lipoprotein NlpI